MHCMHFHSFVPSQIEDWTCSGTSAACWDFLAVGVLGGKPLAAYHKDFAKHGGLARSL